jgi:phosphoglycerate-specific signal transduction histidine kinase
MKKHEVSYHDHDDTISFYSDHCSHLDVFERLYSNQTKKKDLFSKKIFFDQSEIIKNKEIKIFLEKNNNSKMILKKSTITDFSERLIERSQRLIESQRKMNERRRINEL